MKDLQSNQLLLGAKMDMALDMLRLLVDKAGSGNVVCSTESKIDLPISTIPSFLALEKDVLADKSLKDSLVGLTLKNSKMKNLRCTKIMIYAEFE